MSYRRKPVSTGHPHERLTSGSRPSPGRQLNSMEWRDTGFVLERPAARRERADRRIADARARPPCRAGARRAVAAPARAAAAGQQRRGELARPPAGASRHARLRACRPLRRPPPRRPRPAGRARRRERPLCRRRCPSASRTAISTGLSPGCSARSIRLLGRPPAGRRLGAIVCRLGMRPPGGVGVRARSRQLRGDRSRATTSPMCRPARAARYRAPPARPIMTSCCRCRVFCGATRRPARRSRSAGRRSSPGSL